MNREEGGEWSPFMGDNPALLRFRFVCSSPPPPPPPSRAAAADEEDESSWTLEEKKKKPKRAAAAAAPPPRPQKDPPKRQRRADVIDYWTHVLQQDPDDLVEYSEDPGLLRCEPCGTRRMCAKTTTLIQHVVTPQHLKATNTQVRFARNVPTREELYDEIIADPPAEPEGQGLTAASVVVELSPPPLRGGGETFRQRLARIAEEETRKLIHIKPFEK
jgi:hypothetical protein